MRSTVVLTSLVLLAAACTSDNGIAEPTTTASAESTTTTAPPPPDVDRLVIIDAQGRVVAMDRDGASPVVLSEMDDVPFQPAWSFDGSSIAYADRNPPSAFVVADAEGGSAAQRVDTMTPPFYFLWSPSGDEIGSLRNGSTGIIFEITTIGDGIAMTERDRGQPFYYSWSPDGDRLVAHVGVDRLEVLELEGIDDPLIDDPGAFRAPQWSASGVFAARSTPSGQQLLRIAEDGESEVLADLLGAVVFTASPDGQRVAVQSFVEGEGSVSAALPQLSLPPNRLHVIDLETGEAEALTTEPALAFFWSPDGSQLLLLGPGGSAGETRWSVWDGETITAGPAFRPGASWVAEFLPFFDQYAQGVSLWAPDSTAYAFPGAIGGVSGIWVAEPGGEDATKVADGTWVAWSHS